MRDPPKRPKNREVENEMVRPANRQGQPPRPATQPKARRPNPEEMRDD